MMQSKPIIIGLTGSTGSGKTTISNIFKSLNSYIINADYIAHYIIKKGEKAYFEIIENFGDEILKNNGEIDRKKLGQIVFNDNDKIIILNNITHKYIIKEIEDKIKYAIDKNTFKYIVLDAPLLIETNLHKMVDKVWIVTASEKTRLERLKKRDKISEDILIKRIKSQTSFEKNKHFADFIIFNEENTNLEKIIKQELKREI